MVVFRMDDMVGLTGSGVNSSVVRVVVVVVWRGWLVANPISSLLFLHELNQRVKL